MTYMKVDIDNIRNVNSSVPSFVSIVTNEKTGVGLLRNNIDTSIQNRQNIYNNIRNVYASLDTIEVKLSTLYNKVNEFMTQYSQTDNVLKQQSQSLISQINQITANTSSIDNQSSYEEVKRLFDDDLIIKNHDIVTNNITDVPGLNPIISYVENNDNYMGFYHFNYFAEFSKNRNTIWDAITISATDKLGEVKALLKGSSYRQKVIEDSLGEILQNLSKNYLEAKTIPSGVEDIAKILKQGKKINEMNFNKATQDTELYKQLKNYKLLFEGVDKIGDVIDWGNFSIEQIEYWLNNYDANLEYLNSLKSAMSASGTSDADLDVVIGNLIVTYTYRWLGTLKDITYKISDDLTDKIVSTGAGLITGGLYSIVDLGTDLAFKVFNIDDLGDNLMSLYALENYKNKLVSSYDYYAVKIRKGNYSDDDVIQCEKMFDLSKAALLKEYNLMYDISNDEGEKKLLLSEIYRIEKNPYLPNTVFQKYTSGSGSGGGFSGGEGFSGGGFGGGGGNGF